MKSTQPHSSLSEAAHQSSPYRSVAALVLISAVAVATVNATLPDLPKGVSVLNTNGKAIKQLGILNNPDVDMISIESDWNVIEGMTEGSYDWTAIDNDLTAIDGALYFKNVLLRINTMGGAQSIGGNTPDWVYTAMGADPTTTIAQAGVTYSFFDTGDMITRCIPVFWDPNYLAKKKALIAMAGAHLASNPHLKVVVISYANAITEDWYVPHDDSSEVALWLDDPPAGAGYTTQKMIDAAIHQADASFKDGSVTYKTLTSPSAAFTQADVGCLITGLSYRQNTHIASWISPTQVTLDRTILTNNNKGAWFNLKARKDGLIDVAMAAFPNQYIATAVAGNGPDLDLNYGGDAGTVLAETVDNMVQTAYAGRYIVQRNNVSAIIPTKDLATDAWVILADAATAGIPTAGQALGVCYEGHSDNPQYRMNGGNNCDHDNCDFSHPPCVGDCALDWGPILQRSADRIITYSADYYEIYPTDASNLQSVVCCIHQELTGGQCDQCSP